MGEEEKTITLKKDTLWKGAVVILAIALVASIFTAGFGINKSTGSAVQNTGNTAQQNTGATQQQGVVDFSVFTSNPDLYPSTGPSNSKNTVIEVADFQCPWCALASGLPAWVNQSAGLQMKAQSGDLAGIAGNIEQLAEQNKLRFIFVPMSFLGQESIYAAEAGYCANEQGKFWDMHDAIYQASTGPQEDTGKYSKANLEIIAQGISGLDQAKFKNCLETDKYASAVQQATQGAGTIARGTPTFFVNGKQVNPSWAAVQAALQ